MCLEISPVKQHTLWPELTWKGEMYFLSSGCSSLVNWTLRIGYPVDTFKPPSSSSSFSSSIDMDGSCCPSSQQAVAINLGVCIAILLSYLILTSKDESFIQNGVELHRQLPYLLHPPQLPGHEGGDRQTEVFFCVSPWLANSSAPTVCAVSNLKSMGGEWMFGIPIVSAVSQFKTASTAPLSQSVPSQPRL